MTPPLLDRLRQDLPGAWQSPEEAGSFAWHSSPRRTIFLDIGERRLFVGAIARGAIVGEVCAGQRVVAWKALRRSICEGAARIALDHAREGRPIPAVPPWAQQALRTSASCRLRTLAEKEAKIRADLAKIEAERALITLGA